MRYSPRLHRETEVDFDVVDAASAQSFPASDPPAWAIGQQYPAEPEEVSPASERRPRRGRGPERGDRPPDGPEPAE